MNLNLICKICGAQTFKPYRIFQNIEYVRCGDCSVVSMKKIFSSKELAQYYNEDYFEKDYKKSDEFSYFSNHDSVIVSCGAKVALLKEYVTLENSRILEVGCAAGYFLEALKRDTPNVVVEGIEVSPEAAKIAQEIFHIPVIADDLFNVSEGSRYDAIVMFQTLEHLNDPLGYLQKSFALLKEGGYVFVEVPNLRTIDRLFDRGILERIFSVPYHVFMFSPSSLKFVLKKAGFSIVKQRVYMSSAVGSLLKAVMGKLRGKNNITKSDTSVVASTPPTYRTPPKFYSVVRDIAASVAPGSNMLIVAQKKRKIM